MNWYIFVILILMGLIIYYTYKKKKVDKSAIIATLIVGFLSFFAGGVKWIIPLLIFFILGISVSHYNKRLKKKLGVEQKIRTWKNVFANGGTAVIFALFQLCFPAKNPIFFIGLIGAMATAMADTVSTELGQIYGKNPRLITTMKKVPIGTAGAVSVSGFFFGLLGAVVISSLLIFWQYSILAFLICVFAGFFGSVIDSFLGATLEKQGHINTHEINFLTTLFAGILAVIMVYLI